MVRNQRSIFAFLCKDYHKKAKVEALNKFLAWLIPYEGEFETEDELIAILSKINKKVGREKTYVIYKHKVWNNSLRR